MERARDGDLDAFEEIVRARMDPVYRLTFAILGSEADAADAAQETFISAWRQIRRVRDPERFEAWLHRVTINAARMTHRARRRRGVREIASSQVVVSAETAFSHPVPTDGAVLDAALRQLDVDQRAILVLHHLEGRPVSEIAEILEIQVGTVKSRLFTARRALKAAIDESSRS